MNMRFQSLIVALALVLSATATTVVAEWKAGVARVNITPLETTQNGRLCFPGPACRRNTDKLVGQGAGGAGQQRHTSGADHD